MDVRIAKTARVRRVNVQGIIDVYNVLKASPMLSLTTTYGPNWLRPMEILNARLVKFGAQIDF